MNSFISKFYDILVDSFKVSSSYFSKSKIKKDKFKIVPGWNRNVKDKYKANVKNLLPGFNRVNLQIIFCLII